MNDKRDMAPMVWGYIKSRETARRMDAYAGEVQAMHPFYSFDSPARANDMDLATTNAVSMTYSARLYSLTTVVCLTRQCDCWYPAWLLEHASQARQSAVTELAQLEQPGDLG
jgi:hypothetical protein